MFDQWALKNKEDYGSESNPSEDQLNPIERKAKVLSEVKTLKKEKKRKKSPKKKNHVSSQKNNKEGFNFLLRKKESLSFLQNTVFEKEKKKEESKVLTKRKEKEKEITIKKEVKATYLQPRNKEPMVPPTRPKPPNPPVKK